MYGKWEDLENLLINKKIVEWDKDKIVLEDGTKVTIECSEYDCCAGAYGKFTNVQLDAMITSVKEPVVTSVPDDDTVINQAIINIYHNQNVVAQAEVTADAGNGGYYYSVGSFVVKDVHYKVVSA